MTSQQQSQPYIVDTTLNKVRAQTAAPRFSVILCTYNRCNLVISVLASLRRQTLAYDQFEIIVVDNGSGDGTLAAVRSYVSAGIQPGRRPEDTWQVQCLSEMQNGLAHARHTGLLAASGEIAVFLDDDTIADPYFLERLLTAYEESDADAIGGQVELHWEAPRPHWLTDDLLDMLGYFAPTVGRTQLQKGTSFSSSSFSVKIDALRSIGYFSPFLSKRMHLPASLEVHDLCRRLYQAGYSLWYEPAATVAHRAPAARLNRAYFVGRAYWQGRSEVLMLYASRNAKEAAIPNSLMGAMSATGVWQAILPKMREIAYLALIHRPLLRLAGRSTSERLEAAMAQARSWGHLQQRLQFLEHAPLEVTTPAVLLVRAVEPDAGAELLASGLGLQNVSCTQAIADIPLPWLWRHRAYNGQAMGIVHFYRPGALSLTHRQRQRLWFRLWLARHWGIRIVTTDGGGWWQSTRSLRFLARRSLERKLFSTSDMVLAYTRQPDKLYADRKLRRRVRCLPHPGFRGYYAQPPARAEAHRQLGLPPEETSFIYLCLAHMHTERELIQLVETFTEMKKKEQLSKNQGTKPLKEAQLLLVGSPIDKKSTSSRIFKLAALNSSVHLSLTTPAKEAMPLYLGAADAIVLPHVARQTAGVLGTALIGLSYGCVVVAPALPRFRGMLPPHASALYDPASRESLLQALLKAQALNYCMSEKEANALEATSGWGQYAHRLLKLYKHLLNRPTT